MPFFLCLFSPTPPTTDKKMSVTAMTTDTQNCYLFTGSALGYIKTWMILNFWYVFDCTLWFPLVCALFTEILTFFIAPNPLSTAKNARLELFHISMLELIRKTQLERSINLLSSSYASIFFFGGLNVMQSRWKLSDVELWKKITTNFRNQYSQILVRKPNFLLHLINFTKAFLIKSFFFHFWAFICLKDFSEAAQFSSWIIEKNLLMNT